VSNETEDYIGPRGMNLEEKQPISMHSPTIWLDAMTKITRMSVREGGGPAENRICDLLNTSHPPYCCC